MIFYVLVKHFSQNIPFAIFGIAILPFLFTCPIRFTRPVRCPIGIIIIIFIVLIIKLSSQSQGIARKVPLYLLRPWFIHHQS